MNAEKLSISGVPETMLQTMYARAVYSQKPGHKFYDGKAIETLRRGSPAMSDPLK